MICQLSRVGRGRARFFTFSAEGVSAGTATVKATVTTDSGVAKGNSQAKIIILVSATGSAAVL